MQNGTVLLHFSLLLLNMGGLGEIRFRGIFNALLSLPRRGSAWRMLPHDLPPWKTVYHYFHLWRRIGLWEQVHTMLLERVRL